MNIPMEDVHHLSRLPRPYYQAFAMVHWTISMQSRAVGWLDDLFHSQFRECLLHTCIREGLLCPTYVLMPDHLHMIWMGIQIRSDQLNGMRFFRRHLQAELNQKGNSSKDRILLSRQSYDNVLREEERKHDAFQSTCQYLLRNPLEAGLVEVLHDWKWLGVIVPGFPNLSPLDDHFWPFFWKHYAKIREPGDPPPCPPF